MYGDLDVFTIEEDRSLMVTQGSLHMAFNIMSYFVEGGFLSLNFKAEGNEDKFVM